MDEAQIPAHPAGARSPPSRCIWAGVIIAGLLFLAGVLLALYDSNQKISRLCMCIGFAFLLATLGTHTTARSRSPGAPILAIVGAGAVNLQYQDEDVLDPKGQVIFRPQTHFEPPTEDLRPDQAGCKKFAFSKNLVPIRQAWAAETPGSGVNPLPSSEDIDGLIGLLRSDDSEQRRVSREYLVTIGLLAVSPLMKDLFAHRDDYRTKLGVAFVLSHILRDYRSKPSQISEKLGDSDIRMLLQLVQDPDKTIEVYATEALYFLSDNRVVKPTFALTKKNQDPDTKLNLFTVLGNSLSTVPDLRTKQVISEEALKVIPTDKKSTRAPFEAFKVQ